MDDRQLERAEQALLDAWARTAEHFVLRADLRDRLMFEAGWREALAHALAARESAPCLVPSDPGW